MSDAYDRELRQMARDVAAELGFSDFVKEGVYVVLGGPSFETIAECRMLHMLGADAVGQFGKKIINPKHDNWSLNRYGFISVGYCFLQVISGFFF